MKYFLLAGALFLAGCGATEGFTMPQNAVAGCANVEYTGTVTKSHVEGRFLFLSKEQAARIQTVQDAVDLADSVGCNQSR